MHFKLPKPLHGWRVFVGEIGVIVFGVLIALGAEQVVASIHDRAEIRDAEAAMIAELRDDNLPQAYARAAIFNCYAAQLDKIEAAVGSGDRASVVNLARAYRPVGRSYDDQAWQAAVASQVLVHSGAKRMLAWSTAYRLIPRLGNRSAAEQDVLGQLYANIGGSGPLTSTQQDRLFEVISTLRRQNVAMAGTSLVFINVLARQGLTLAKEQKAGIRNDARRIYGACVIEPAPEQVDINSQLIVGDDALKGRKQR